MLDHVRKIPRTKLNKGDETQILLLFLIFIIAFSTVLSSKNTGLLLFFLNCTKVHHVMIILHFPENSSTLETMVENVVTTFSQDQYFELTSTWVFLFLWLF